MLANREKILKDIGERFKNGTNGESFVCNGNA